MLKTSQHQDARPEHEEQTRCPRGDAGKTKAEYARDDSYERSVTKGNVGSAAELVTSHTTILDRLSPKHVQGGVFAMHTAPAACLQTVGQFSFAELPARDRMKHMATTSNLQPIELIPKQQQVVWGGHALSERFGKPGSDEPVGESWEIWEGDPVATGEFSRQTLSALVDSMPREVMGSIPVDRGWTRFPLLTKFIDAHEPLSVQVHPDDAAAQRLENQPYGKTEAWHIIDADPEAWVIHGLTQPVEAAEFRRRLENGTADDLLRKVEAKPGETIFVPARTVHAIGPGILLHEVQQTSDVTYRLYDWNRQSQGSKRELHLDKGLEVSLLEPSAHPIVEPLSWQQDGSDVAWILASRYFSVKNVSLSGTLQFDTNGSSFHILTVLDGTCGVHAQDSRLTLDGGQSLLVPASMGAYALTSDACNVLVEYIDDLGPSTLRSVEECGVSRDDVESFLRQFVTP